jgi:hypothetical protein
MAIMLLMVLALTGCGGTEPSPETETPQELANTVSDITIGTAAAGGAWYPIGATMADIIMLSDLGVQANVATTGGSIENCKLVQDMTCEIAITVGYQAYDAMNGNPPYEGKYEDLRCVFSGLSYGVLQVVVPDNSDIKSFADLAGKRVAAGPAGGGAILVLDMVLNHYGLSMSDVRASYVSYEEGVTMMTDGQVDAAVAYAGIATPAISTLKAKNEDFRMLGFTEEEMDELLKVYPFFSKIIVPSDMYGLDVDTITVGTANIVFANANLEEDLVYDICKLFFTEENLKRIQDSQPSVELTLENATRNPIPWHPGAERYFKEIGLIE